MNKKIALAVCSLFILSLALTACSSGASGLPDPCAPACGEHGVCDAFSDPAVCVCFPGWTGPACDECAAGYEDDGAGHCVLPDEPESCTTGSCSGHGLCDDSGGSVECDCLDGYTGERCNLCAAGYHMTEFGDCAEDLRCGTPDPCAPHGTCDDSSGTILCVCDAGWSGSLCDSCAEGYHADGLDCAADESCPAQDPCAPGGVCNDENGRIECDCLEAYTGDMCDSCAPGYVDYGSGCEEGTSCEDYPFADNAYVYQMDYGEENERCCFDYTGDGLPDNAFGALIDVMSSFIGEFDFNQMLADSIMSGELCLIFDLQGLDSVEDDAQVLLSLFSGADSDGDYENNLTGDEDFTVNADAFQPGESGCSMRPLNAFDAAWVDQGVLFAEAEEIHGLIFPSPLMPDSLEALPLKQVKLTAHLSRGSHGLLMAEGRMGGTIGLEAIFSQINEFVAANCSCMNLGGEPLLTYGVDGEQWAISCAETPDSTCTAADSPCDTLAGYCPYFIIFTQTADVDTDGDSIDDALSVGLRLTATSATVTGISQ